MALVFALAFPGRDTTTCPMTLFDHPFDGLRTIVWFWDSIPRGFVIILETLERYVWFVLPKFIAFDF